MAQTDTSIPLRQPLLRYFLFLIVILLPPASARAADLSGRVIAVPDATRIVLQTEQGARLRVKLAGIRYPRSLLGGADIGKRHLHMLLAGHVVTVDVITRHPGGVILGRVLHGGADVGLQMLKSGLAEAAANDGLDPALLKRYRQAEQEARSRQMGYWQPVR
jgi:endonuclease YncB( thermonuclease family)